MWSELDKEEDGAITVEINREDVTDWLNLDSETGEDYAEELADLYAEAMQKILAEWNPGVEVEVKLVCGMAGGHYISTAIWDEDLEAQYQAACDRLARFDWLPGGF